MDKDFPQKDFIVALYDLLGNNTEYQPRETLNSLLNEYATDYCVDVDNEGVAKIVLTQEDEKGRQLAEWQITIQQTYNGEE